MKRTMIALAAMLIGQASPAVEWKNLDDAHRLSGRKTSSGYLLGKVVMVDRWGAHCPPCRALLPRLEAIWQSFKGPSFVLLGGHCKGWGDAAEVKKLADENGLTYPIYEDAGLAENEPKFNSIPYLYVVDPTGKIVYRGHNERVATDVVVGQVNRWESPHTLADWKRCLEWEIDNQPAHAIVRHAEFAKAFPEEAKAYTVPIRAFGRLPDMDKLVKLVKLAQQLSFYRVKDEAERKNIDARVAETLEKYAFLKSSKDPQIQREAKNALADLTWGKVEL